MSKKTRPHGQTTAGKFKSPARFEVATSNTPGRSRRLQEDRLLAIQGMSTTRPRPSLIKLFDPLANVEATTSDTSSTPRRDDVDTNKENYDSPDGLTMTMFVNKIFKPVSHPQPAPLKRRLIDIGDITLEDAACPDALLDQSIEEEFNVCFEQVQDDDNATLTFRDMVKAATPHKSSLKPVVESLASEIPPILRLPLADISEGQTMRVSLPKNISKKSFPEHITVAKETTRPEKSAPQVVIEPELTVTPAVSPEDVPLPPSPIMNQHQFNPFDSVIDAVPSGEPSISAGAVQPDFKLTIDATAAPTVVVAVSHNVDNDDSASQTDSDKKNSDLPIAEERTPTEPYFGLESSKLDISSNPDTSSIDFHPSTNVSDSSASTEPSSDMSIPVIISRSSPPSSPISSPQQSQHERDAEMPISPLARLRLSPPTAPDCNRMSVDLHASFQMLMESEDMSFNLLNDKVSFLQNGMESFLTATEDDPSFDLEAEKIKMEKTLKKHFVKKSVQEEKASEVDAASSASSSPGPSTPADVTSPSTPHHPSFNVPQIAEQGTVHMKRLRKRLSIPVAISSRTTDVSSPTNAKRLMRSPSVSFSPPSGLGMPVRSSQLSPTSSGAVFVPSRQLRKLQLTTPKTGRESIIPQMPVAVPALKIVKRTRPNGHERIGSDSATNPSVQWSKIIEQKAVTSAKELVAPLKVKVPPKVPEIPQTPGIEAEPKPARPRASTNFRASISSAQTAGQGPRRVPISEGPQIKASATPRAVTMPALTSGGPRRVPLQGSSSALLAHRSRPSITESSGLKTSTQVGSTSSTATSSLPKPRTSNVNSRLPAPRNLKTGGLPVLRRAT